MNIMFSGNFNATVATSLVVFKGFCEDNHRGKELKFSGLGA